MEVDEGSDQKSDIMLHWMAAHVRLKEEFTEDEKSTHDMAHTFLLRTEENYFFNNHQMNRLMTKPTKWHVLPAKTQISLGIPLSDQSLRCLHEESLGS